jgi:hypothetical protein
MVMVMVRMVTMVVLASDVVVPRLVSPSHTRPMYAVPLGRCSGASLERPPERQPQSEGNGEQQYEEAEWPQEVWRSRRWARPSECVGRSLSAWSRTSAEARTARITQPG